MNPFTADSTRQTSSTDLPSYEQSRNINIELGPRGAPVAEQLRETDMADPKQSKFGQLVLKCGKSTKVRWALVIISLLSAYGLGMGVGGYKARREGVCEQYLPAVMNGTIAAGNPLVSGGGRMVIRAEVPGSWLLLLGGLLLGRL